IPSAPALRQARALARLTPPNANTVKRLFCPGDGEQARRRTSKLIPFALMLTFSKIGASTVKLAPLDSAWRTSSTVWAETPMSGSRLELRNQYARTSLAGGAP